MARLTPLTQEELTLAQQVHSLSMIVRAMELTLDTHDRPGPEIIRKAKMAQRRLSILLGEDVR